MTTASGSVIIERRYTAKNAHYAREARLLFDGCDEHAGITDPILTEPIDFDGEIAERKETHEPIEPVTSDLRNTLFGI